MKEPVKKQDKYLYSEMSMNNLINDVLHQITSDIEHGDIEALDEFLKLIYNADTHPYFVGYLSEEQSQKYDDTTIERPDGGDPS